MFISLDIPLADKNLEPRYIFIDCGLKIRHHLLQFVFFRKKIILTTQINMKPRFALILIACLTAYTTNAPLYSLTVKDIALTQTDADDHIRHNTAWSIYYVFGGQFQYRIGDGPMNMSVGENVTFSGYTYNYPGLGPIPGDGWSDKNDIVHRPMNGNVIHGFGYSDYTEYNTIRGNSAKSYNLIFSDNTAERSTIVDKFPSDVYTAGGAVYLSNADIGDLNSLVFSKNTLSNKLSSVSSSHPEAEGGALWISNGVLSNINEIRFDGNSASSKARTNGGAFYLGAGLIENVGSLAFEQNKATAAEWVMGGALYSQGTVTIQKVNSVSFLGNESEINKMGGDAYGGGFASNEGGDRFYLKSINRILFSGNSVRQAEFQDSGSLTGSGRLWGGAVYHSGHFYVQNSGSVEFSSNLADGSTHAYGSFSVEGGAIHAAAAVFTGNSSILFENNSAIRHSESIRENLPDVPKYSSIGAFGGAIMTPQAHFYSNTGDVVFRNNYATDRGGALFQYPLITGKGSTSWLSADGGDITFIGNTHKLAASNERNSGIANAVWVEPSWNTVTGSPSILRIRAKEGHFVNFYDPVCSEFEGNPSDYYHTENSYEKASIYLGTYFSFDEEGNMIEDYTGTIRFSGEHVRETLAGSENSPDYEFRVEESKKSVLHATVSQYSGTLLLEHGVTFGTRGTGDLNDESNKTGTVFLQYKGILDISGSAEHGETTLAGRDIQFAGIGYAGQDSDPATGKPFVPADPDAIMSILKPGNMARFDADNIDMSSGMTINFGHHMTTSGFVDINAIRVTAGKFILGGTLGIQDNAIDRNYYYADNRWAKVHSFALFHDVDNTHEGDFDGVKSLASGSNRIESPYTYSGTWSQEWVDTNADGVKDQLHVVWTPDHIEEPDNPGVDPDPEEPELPVIKDILPELAGALAMNSMWSSASNIKSVSNAALGTLGTERFLKNTESDYWFKGLGDFTYHGAMESRDGYDYNGGGYALGFDRKITNKAILGLAFGNLFGKMSGRSYIGNNTQTSDIGILYGGWRTDINDKNIISITGTAGYGWTKNSMTAFHTGGWSQGKWDNNTYFGTFQGQWEHTLANDWAFNVLLGLEYTDVSQKAFTETGWDSRRFEKGSLRNMSLPVGLGISRLTAVNGMSWKNGLSVSYVPDVYRENPHANAMRLMNGYAWTARGVAPDRHAVRVSFNSSLAISPAWTVYAAYEFEGRNQAIYHRVNAGMSFSY